MRFKDANECLQAGITRDEMLACVSGAEVLRPPKLKNIYDFENDIWEKFHPASNAQLGLLLPWGNRFGSSLAFRFRYGEVTVWTGYNKHGKSEVLNHCIVDMCWQGERALVCSLEIQAPQTYQKLIRMASARREVCSPEERAQFRDRCLKPLAQKIWVYDHVGNAPITDVLNVILYAFQRYGCRQFVLDSLMKFDGLDGEGQEIWNAQRGFMNALLEFAAKYGVHIHLVAHSRKPDKKGESYIPRRYDVMGSAYITNLAFNVIVVWRNRAKQDALEKLFQKFEQAWSRDYPNDPMPKWKRLLGGPPPLNAPKHIHDLFATAMAFIEKQPEKDQFASLVMGDKTTGEDHSHDCYFIVDAQRGGDGDCPARELWFHYDSLQFIEANPWSVKRSDPRGQPVDYMRKQVAEMDEEI